MADAIQTARRAGSEVAGKHPGLSLLVLYGSRARPDGRPDSDWDFAYLETSPIDALALRADLADSLATDRIDLVRLDRASALLRYRVARDGAPLVERPPGIFGRFWLDAVQFWCEVEPIVRAGHEAIIAELEK